jgi:uncharacterized membrane protein YqjE
MALLGALLSFFSKKLGDLVRAVLGWSVTALFGQLSSAKQTALSAALLASLLWPLLVVGIFQPAVTAWALAALPVHKWIGDRWVRVITIALVVLVPPLVGLVTRWVAPSKNLRGSALRSALYGYPLTVGYAISCTITAVTVPIVKVGSLLKRWKDEHVFVQPMGNEYPLALAELVRACESAGINAPIIEDVPPAMSVSTKVLKWFARGALDPIVAENPKRIRGAALELYLYPADLLLRGEATLLARVRARMTRTALEQHAFLVATPESQDIQCEIARMWAVLARHATPDEIGGLARGRLSEIRRELDDSYLPFEEWVTLDRSLERLEREFGGGLRIATTEEPRSILDRRNSPSPITPITPTSPAAREQESMAHPQDVNARVRARSDEPALDLVKDAIHETQELIKLEVALATKEVKSEVAELKASAILFGVSAVVAILGTSMLLVALVLAIGPAPIVALIVGAALLFVAAIAAFIAMKQLPKAILNRTRRRLGTDINQLKEHVA